MLDATNIFVPAESFPQEVCPTCGYSLKGLPLQGVCPECGANYDDSQLPLHGWAHGRHATASNTRGWSFGVALFPFLFLWQVCQHYTSRSLRAIYGVAWLVSIVLALMKRKSTDHPGAIQVRMNHKGGTPTCANDRCRLELD